MDPEGYPKRVPERDSNGPKKNIARGSKREHLRDFFWDALEFDFKFRIVGPP